VFSYNITHDSAYTFSLGKGVSASRGLQAFGCGACDCEA
jgi:hypothetical protein